MHERAERKKSADKAKAASTAARKDAAAAADSNVPLAIVNQGFVDGGGESSGDFQAEEARVEVEVEVEVHAEEEEEEEESTIPKAFYGFPAPSSSRPAFFAEEDNGPLPVVPIRWNRIRARHARLVSL